MKLVFISVTTPGVGLHERVLRDLDTIEEIAERNAADGYTGPVEIKKTVECRTFADFKAAHFSGSEPRVYRAWDSRELGRVHEAPVRTIFSIIPSEPERYIAPGMHVQLATEFFISRVPWDPKQPSIFAAG